MKVLLKTHKDKNGGRIPNEALLGRLPGNIKQQTRSDLAVFEILARLQDPQLQF